MKKSQSSSVRLSTLASAVAAVLAAGALSTAAYAQAQQPEAPSNGAPASPQLEEVVVTGTRIARPNATSDSPIVTVNTQQLESQAGLNVESFLNKLPNFNPAAAPTTAANQDVQNTAVHAVGIATISLRGFGANRNLVLINGHRTVPVDALGETDVNSIPTALVERVDVMTGGASAVYGADAISGVTNFILRTNFQGFEFDAQDGITEAGDGQQSRITALLGTNFADGKGNVTFEAEHYQRRAAYDRNRDFYTDAWQDPLVAGNAIGFVFGANGYNTVFNPPSTAAMNAVFPARAVDPASGLNNQAFGYGSAGNFQGLRFNSDGTLFTLNGDLSTSNYKGPTGPSNKGVYALQTTYDSTIAQQGVKVNTLKWDNPQSYVSSPQERWSFFGSTNYDLTDKVHFFSRLNWAQNKTHTVLIPTNASFGWEAQIPYDPTTDSPINPAITDTATLAKAIADPTNPLYANPSFIAHGQPGAQHPVPVQLAALLNSRAAPSVFCAPGPTCLDPTTNPALVGTVDTNSGRLGSWVAETYPYLSFPERATDNSNTVWQLASGLNFDLGSDWNGELYYSHGEAHVYTVTLGDNSLARWRGMVTQPDYGLNAVVHGNEDGASPGFGTVDVPCTSGFYDTLFHGDAVPTADCQYAVEATLQSDTLNQQDDVELNFNGPVAQMPAGELRAAAGFEYRKHSAQFTPDILQSTASFEDQVIGVYPAAYMDASTSTKDYYGELFIPVVKKFSLDVGARYSEPEHTKSDWTYKLEGDFDATQWLRLRGGYNRAVRAPNLGELFLGRQELFTSGGNFGDPCGARSNSPFGARYAEANTSTGHLVDNVLSSGEQQVSSLASGQTQAGANSTYLICLAQMGGLGSKAANQFYDTANATGTGGGGFAWVLQEGNPNLQPETADTWTAGLQVTSPFDKPGLRGLRASIDWWKIHLSDAIEQYSIDYANYLCYGATTVTSTAEAEAQAASPACQNLPRNQATGGALTTLLAYANQATIEDAGVDLGVEWFAQFADLGFTRLPGGLGINVTTTWLNYYRTKASPAPFDVETDWKGSLGPDLAGTDGGAYAYRVFTDFNWVDNNKSISLRWRHYPSVWGAGHASQEAVIAHDEQVAASGQGVMLSYTPSTEIKTPSYDIFDISFNVDIGTKFSVRGGIDNLLDVSPRITGASAGYPYEKYSKLAADGKPLLAHVCDGATSGCQNPVNYSLPNSGAGVTNGGYYDPLGRQYFVGFKVRF